MRFIRTFAFVAVVSFFGIAPHSLINGQSRTNISGTGGIHQIKGRIHLPNGQTAEEPMKVELQSGNFSTLSVESDRSGSFAFQNLAPGNYTVVIDAGDDFETSRESVTIDTPLPAPRGMRVVETSRSTNVPIHLRLKRVSNNVGRNEVINVKWANVPKDAISSYNRGLAHVKRDENDEAIAEFQKAIESYRQFAPAHTALGKMYLMTGKLDAALDSPTLAVQYDPADFDARLNFGVCLLNKKDLDFASRELARAAEMDKSAVTPRYYLGLLYIQKQDLDRAQLEMEAAKQLIGSMPFPLLQRYIGGIYVAKKLNDQAVKELETYIAEDPKTKDVDRIKETIAQLKKSPNE